MLLQETIISGFLSVAVMLTTLLLLSFHEPAHAADKLVMAAAFLQSGTTSDPVARALQRFAQLQSYQVMVRSVSSQDETKVIRYSYRKPGHVRMDFSTPHAGAALIYNPGNGKVKLWPFGVGTFPVLNLSPTDSLITDENGHRVDQSDLGVLLNNIRHLQQGAPPLPSGRRLSPGNRRCICRWSAPKERPSMRFITMRFGSISNPDCPSKWSAMDWRANYWKPS
jgi:hypothetical protein